MLYKGINSYTERFCWNCWYKAVMNKTKVEVYRVVLRDVSQNFEREENFIKQRMKKYVNERKNLLKRYFIFYIFLVILLL